jgi:glutathione synthase
MKVAVWVNDAAGVEPKQTTAGIVAELGRRGHEVHVCGVRELAVTPGGAIVCRDRQGARVDLAECDAVWVRTNPGRDKASAWAHEVGLRLLERLEREGVRVLNPPGALTRAGSKLYLCELSERVRPRTLVARDREELRAFVASCQGACVLKPLDGTHGRDVFKVDASAPSNLNQILDVLGRGGFVMAQQYVEEAWRGDVRVIMVDGEPLRVGGRACVVRRVPGGGDFRSNVSAGGSAVSEEWGEELERVAAELGPKLRADGLFMVGADVIGGKLVEVNVYSPGGIGDASAFAGVDFMGALVDRFEARV